MFQVWGGWEPQWDVPGFDLMVTDKPLKALLSVAWNRIQTGWDQGRTKMGKGMEQLT